MVYDIFAGKSRPRGNHAIMLAFGLRCDAILIWCIENGLTRAEADDELFRLGEKTLLGTDRLG